MELKNYELGIKYRKVYLIYYDPIKKQDQQLEIKESEIQEYKSILQRNNTPHRFYYLTIKLENYRDSSEVRSLDLGI